MRNSIYVTLRILQNIGRRLISCLRHAQLSSHRAQHLH